MRLRLQVAAAVAVLALLVGAPLLDGVNTGQSPATGSQHAAANADRHGERQ